MENREFIDKMTNKQPASLYDVMWIMFVYLTLTESLWYIIPSFIFLPLWVYWYDRSKAWKDYETMKKDFKDGEE